MNTQLRDYPVNTSRYIYHRDIGFPSTAEIKEGFYNLTYTRHAKERQEIKYGGLRVLPSVLNITKDKVVEIHTDDNITAKKLLVRIGYDKKRDIVLAIQPMDGVAKVITFWLNDKKDTHRNLDKTKYTRP